MAFMTKKLKAVLYGILPFIMIILCVSMITYIFAATKFELLISGQIGYEVQKGTGTEEDPFLIYSVGPNDGTAKIGTFNFYAGNNAEGKDYFSSTSPQYYFKQANDITGSDFIQTTLLGFYDGNGYGFDASGSNKAIFSAIGSSSVTTSKLEDLNVVNNNSTASAGVVTSLGKGTIDNVTFSGSITSSANYVGGIIGGAVNTMVSANNCFFALALGPTYAIGSTSSGSGTALSTMQTQTTYTNSGWTFGTVGTATFGWVWATGNIVVNGNTQNYTMPRLWFENVQPATYACACGNCGGRVETKSSYCSYCLGAEKCNTCGGCYNCLAQCDNDPTHCFDCCMCYQFECSNCLNLLPNEYYCDGCGYCTSCCTCGEEVYCWCCGAPADGANEGVCGSCSSSSVCSNCGRCYECCQGC